MSNHTGTMGACQDYAHDPRPESTPSHSHSSPDSIDRRLVHRYGAWLLTGGYTALPTYAWVYYARLGVSEAEMVCVAQLCTYWWSARDPFPGESALATRMGKTVRTIQGYLRSLQAKGLLHIQTRLSTNGRQSTNAYDLRPFFAAVEGRARLDGLLPARGPAGPAPRRPRRRRPPRTMRAIVGHVTITTGHRGTRNGSRYVQARRVLERKTGPRTLAARPRGRVKDRAGEG